MNSSVATTLRAQHVSTSTRWKTLRSTRRYDGLSAFVTPTPAGCSQFAGSHRGFQARRSKALQEADEAMSRPTLAVADIVRAAGNSFWEQQQSHLAWPYRKALDAIVRCRTAALGGHRDQCVRCGHQAISYNSCRNRHCPRCQGNARSRWLAERRTELLPVSYFHIVFTLPHELSALALQNKRLLYDLLFRASAATLLELAGDPKHLGADIGFLGVLHTWGQNLHHHPHIHYVVPAGGFAPDGSRWIPSSRRFFLPVAALSRVFRGKFAAGLKQLFLQHKLQFHGSLQRLAEPRRVN